MIESESRTNGVGFGEMNSPPRRCSIPFMHMSPSSFDFVVAAEDPNDIQDIILGLQTRQNSLTIPSKTMGCHVGRRQETRISNDSECGVGIYVITSNGLHFQIVVIIHKPLKCCLDVTGVEKSCCTSQRIVGSRSCNKPPFLWKQIFLA